MKGTSLGTVTDSEGKYSVQVPKGYEVLVYSYTGYTSQEIKLGVQNVVNVKLEGGVTLSETVVTAYGISKYKNEVAFSAQKVTGDELTRTRDANVVNSLSGKVAGLNIKRTNTLASVDERGSSLADTSSIGKSRPNYNDIDEDDNESELYANLQEEVGEAVPGDQNGSDDDDEARLYEQLQRNGGQMASMSLAIMTCHRTTTRTVRGSSVFFRSPSCFFQEN